jgi:arsenite methyltransferase
MGCSNNQKSEILTQEVIRESYGKIAVEGGTCCGSSSFSKQVSQALGYQADELAVLPEGADMGLSCGNPNALAALKPGEVVLDLGSGGGFDVFLAARKVGPSGFAIGVDMTPEMITKARKNLISFQAQTGFDNVEFRLGEIEHLPVGDNSVDVVLSNCVLNLSVDKAQVWREIHRVLKLGGRVAISDVALLKTLPEGLKKSVEALVGCIAGAVLLDETKKQVLEAGLVEATFTPRPDYVQAMKNLKDPLAKKLEPLLPKGTEIGDYVTSVDIGAIKPLKGQ